MEPFYKAGLDGVIIQDIGALSLLGNCFPGLELHASTQMTVTDVRGAVFLQKPGVSRVVPARELTLPEVEALCRESGMEVGGLYSRGHVLLLFRTMSVQQPAGRAQRQQGKMCPALPPAISYPDRKSRR